MTKLGKWIATAILACSWACGGPEQSTVEQFFRAAQSNDHSTIAAMSAVGPPLAVASWKVLEVTSRSKESFTLPNLLVRLEAAKTERDAALEATKTYLTDQQDALERIVPRLRDEPEYEFRGKLGEIQKEWLKLTEQRKEKEGVFQELKGAVDREARLASKSVMRQLKIENLDGDVAVTEMLLGLKPQDGDELPFRVTLRKYDLSEAESDRIEAARWVIFDIEAATPEAQAAVARAREAASASGGAAASKTANEQDAAARELPAPKESTELPRELRGTARVQILAPGTEVQGDDVVTTVRAQNVSKDWITRFTVTEHWYDDQGNVVQSGSRTHSGRFMPGETIQMELRTRKNPKFFQNQFEFSHVNGDVKASVVGSFSKSTEE